MSDIEDPGEETLPEEETEIEEDDEAAAGPAKPRVKAKVKGVRYAPMCEADWKCVRDMYEIGGYTQRQLVDWCKAKGISISQSAVSRRAMKEAWVAASTLERVRKEVLAEQTSHIGDGLRGMLDQHVQQSQVVINEALLHFRKASEIRKHDPAYVMPPQAFGQVSLTLKMGQEMQARAMGWSYKEGRPYRPDDNENDKGLQKLEVGVLSPAEESEIRASLEKGAAGDEE